jgi:hypothetical protein
VGNVVNAPNEIELDPAVYLVATSAKPQKYFQLLSTFLPFFYCQQGRKDGQAMQA